MRPLSFSKLFFTGVLLCLPLRVGAFTVEPSIFDVQTEAGNPIDRLLTVKNTDDQPTEFFLAVQKFIAGENGAPLFLDPSDIQGLPSWIQVSAPEFRLDSGQEQQIRVRVLPPKETASGGYYAAIFASEKKTGESAVGITRRIASLWLVNVKNGTEAGNARFAFTGTSSLVANGLKREGNVKIPLSNNGTVHGLVRVKTMIEAWPWKTQETMQDVRLLPQETRELSANWKAPVPPLKLRISTKLYNEADKEIARQENEAWNWLMIGVSSGFFLLLVGGIVLLLRCRSRRRTTFKV